MHVARVTAFSRSSVYFQNDLGANLEYLSGPTNQSADSKTPENGIFAVRMGWYPLTSMIMIVLGVRLDSFISRSSNFLRF